MGAATVALQAAAGLGQGREGGCLGIPPWPTGRQRGGQILAGASGQDFGGVAECISSRAIIGKEWLTSCIWLEGEAGQAGDVLQRLRGSGSGGCLRRPCPWQRDPVGEPALPRALA